MSLGSFNFDFLKTSGDDDDNNGSDGSLSFADDPDNEREAKTPLNKLLDDDDMSFGESSSTLPASSLSKEPSKPAAEVNLKRSTSRAAGGKKVALSNQEETSPLFASSSATRESTASALTSPGLSSLGGSGTTTSSNNYNHNDHSSYVAKLKKLNKKVAIKATPKKNLGQISEYDADDSTAVHSNLGVKSMSATTTMQPSNPDGYGGARVSSTSTLSSTTTGTTGNSNSLKSSSLPTSDMSISRVDSSASDLDGSAMTSTTTNTNTTTTTSKKSSGYTDVASLRKKHKQKPKTKQDDKILFESSLSTTTAQAQAARKRKSSSSDHSTNNNNPLNHQNVLEDLYGEGAGLGSTTQLKNLENSGVASSSQSSSSSRRFARTILPFKQADNTGTSGSSAGGGRGKKNESVHSGGGGVGDNESLFLSLDGSNMGDTMAAAAAVVRNGMKPQRNFKKGENVLIALPAISEEVPQLEEEKNKLLRKPTVALVNKYGYPENKGKKEEHKLGPFVYVIAEVVKIHFKESARHYTVARADTGALVRADTGWMEPIEAGSEAEKVALEAAQIKEDEPEGTRGSNVVLLEHTWLKSCCNSIRESFVWVKNAVKVQATKFVDGENPYRCEISITTVNVTVICSLIIVYLDLIKYAFFVKSADFALGVLQFIAWTYLTLELMFQLFVRPDNYSILLKGMEAYNPKTVHYINRFHLFFEGFALVYAMPDFLPIFGIKPYMNTVKASVFATVGNPILNYIRGHFFFFFSRLRLFCLVRHKRNHWINALYLDKKDAKRTNFDVVTTFQDATSNPRKLIRTKSSKFDSLRNAQGLQRKKKREKDDDDLLPKAAKIGTALLLVNSQRILMLLLLITFAVPIITSVTIGGPNKTIYQMTDYLHEINKWSHDLNVTKDDDYCNLTKATLSGWIGSESSTGINSLDVSLGQDQPIILWAQIKPFRSCQNDTLFNDGIITPCNKIREYSNTCGADMSIEDFEEAYDLRHDTLINVTLVDGDFETTVIYNLSHTVSLSCFNSFLLQLLLMLLIWLSLAVLRHDANQLVLTPLTKLLMIVLRYATNPLAPTPSEKTRGLNNQNGIDDFGSMDFDLDLTMDESGDDKLGSYETEQLITAVKKITDLLRKCWGVAGAGIISSNLAKNMNTDKVVFNPTVPGKKVYALFGFAGINEFGHLLQSLDKEVMTLINDIAFVLHNEVYRWGLGDSGQCNKNLGGAFLMVFRIGDFDEVRQKNDAAKKVLFSNSNDNFGSFTSSCKNLDVDNDLNGINLASLPGINQFGDRALLGFLKAYAGLNRDKNIKTWEKDYRVGGGVDAFSVGLSYGMDAGWAVEGAVGSSYKIDATYLSRHVNMAARMMSACKQYRLPILLSQAVEELLSGECRGKLRHIDTVYVKGSKAAQAIYTYDARHQGVSFFLNMRTPEQADKEANAYSPKIWEKDQDLKDMRGHISNDFLSTFKKGKDHYLEGRWTDAVRALEDANEIMIADMVDTGRIEVVASVKMKLMDKNTTDEDAIHMRGEFGDGPSQTLLSYIKNRNCIAPETWEGVRPLMSK